MRPCRHIEGLRATAMSIAWEQVRSWQIFMTAANASNAVGLAHKAGRSWTEIADRLARMWLSLHKDNKPRPIPAFHRDARRIHPIDRIAA